MAGEASVFQFTDHEFWGLDVCFRTFNKMYIRDILDLQEYPTSPGAFCYKNHPIYKVDVLGTVVKVEERNNCFVYAVDDGTGVISCSFWINSGDDASDMMKKFQKLPSSLLMKVESILSIELENEGHQLGDLLHVQGKINLYQDVKQISVSYHTKVMNPVAELVRMSELPLLYRQWYDKPFQLPSDIRHEKDLRTGEKEMGQKSQLCIIKEISDAVKTYLTEAPSVHQFTTHDMIRLKSVQSILHQKSDITRSAYDSLVTRAVTLLEEQHGCVCRRTDQHNAYEALLDKSELQELIFKILVAEKREQQNIVTKAAITSMFLMSYTGQFSTVSFTRLPCCSVWRS